MFVSAKSEFGMKCSAKDIIWDDFQPKKPKFVITSTYIGKIYTLSFEYDPMEV